MYVCVYAFCFRAGTKHSGESLGDIILPPCSKGDPQEFVRVHREVSVSNYGGRVREGG